jgi:hypothetical protein
VKVPLWLWCLEAEAAKAGDGTKTTLEKMWKYTSVCVYVCVVHVSCLKIKSECLLVCVLAPFFLLALLSFSRSVRPARVCLCV